MSKKDKQREIEILRHTVQYWYRKDQEMPESEQEHVTYMIEQGYLQGELNCLMPDGNTENRGWWAIRPNYEDELIDALRKISLGKRKDRNYTKADATVFVTIAEAAIKKYESH